MITIEVGNTCINKPHNLEGPRPDSSEAFVVFLSKALCYLDIKQYELVQNMIQLRRMTHKRDPDQTAQSPFAPMK